MKKILSKSPYLAMLIACLSFHAEIANAASGDSSNSKVATTSSETSVAKTDPSVAVTAPSPSAGASDKAVAGSAEAKNTDNPEEDSPEMALRREEARRRFERGIVLHKEGDFRLALLEFERASELMPTYKVLFNIAQVSADLGYHARAFLAYHHYLDQGGDEVKESRRGYIIDELKILKEKISMFRIQTIPKQLTIRVDNAPPESYDGYIVVDAGRHTLQMSKEGYDTLNEAILFAPGEERELSFKLKKSKIKFSDPFKFYLKKKVNKDYIPRA